MIKSLEPGTSFEIIHGEDGDNFYFDAKSQEGIKAEIEKYFQIQPKSQIILDQNGTLFDQKKLSGLGLLFRQRNNKFYVFNREMIDKDIRSIPAPPLKNEPPTKKKAMFLFKKEVIQNLGNKTNTTELAEKLNALLLEACTLHYTILHKIERTTRQSESENKIRSNFVIFHEQRKKTEERDKEELILKRQEMQNLRERIKKAIAELELTDADIEIDDKKKLIEHFSREKIDTWQKSYQKLLDGFEKKVAEISSKCDSLKATLSEINPGLHSFESLKECTKEKQQEIFYEWERFIGYADEELGSIFKQENIAAQGKKFSLFCENSIPSLQERIEGMKKDEARIDKILIENKRKLRKFIIDISKLEENLKYDSPEMKLAKDLWRRLDAYNVYLSQLETFPNAYEIAKREITRRRESDWATLQLVHELSKINTKEAKCREDFFDELRAHNVGVPTDFFQFLFKPYSKATPLLKIIIDILEGKAEPSGKDGQNKSEPLAKTSEGLEGIISTLSANLEESESANENLKKFIKDFTCSKDDFENLQYQNMELLQKIDILEQNLKVLLGEKENLEMSISIKGSYNFPSKGLNQLDSEKQGINWESNLGKYELDLKAKDVELLNKVEELNAKEEELSSKVEELNANKEELSRKVEELNAKEEQLSSYKKKMELELKVKEVELKAMEQQMSTYKQKEEELSSKVEELNAKEEQLSSYKKNMELELKVKEDELKAIEQQMSTYKRTFELKLEAKEDELIANLGKLKTSNDELKARNEQLSISEKKNDALSLDLEKMSTSNNTSNKEIQRLNNLNSNYKLNLKKMNQHNQNECNKLAATIDESLQKYQRKFENLYNFIEAFKIDKHPKLIMKKEPSSVPIVLDCYQIKENANYLFIYNSNLEIWEACFDTKLPGVFYIATIEKTYLRFDLLKKNKNNQRLIYAKVKNIFEETNHDKFKDSLPKSKFLNEFPSKPSVILLSLDIRSIFFIETPEIVNIGGLNNFD